MPQDQRPFTIDFVKPALPEATRYAATLGFTADIEAREHATVVRSWKNEKDEWKNQYLAEIDGPCRVRVKHAWLKYGTRDNKPYIQIDGLMLPRALAEAIAEAAQSELGKQLDAPAGKKGGKR